MITRNMVKNFCQGDLEYMAYSPSTTSQENSRKPWAQDHQGEIVSPYPEFRSFYICFFTPDLIHIFLSSDILKVVNYRPYYKNSIKSKPLFL